MVARTRKIVLFLLLLFLLSTGVFVFLHSPGFYLSAFDVSGHRQLTEDEVIQLSGLLYGEHLMVAFDNTVRDAITASPWVADARVRMSYPGTVVITIRERTPVALLIIPGSGFYLVDARGFPLAEKSGPGVDWMIITGMSHSDMARDDRPASYRLTTALRVAQRAQDVSLSLPVQEVHVNQQGEVELFMAAGVRALLGTIGADLGHLLQVLETVLVALGDEARSVDYVDLRFERPVVQKR